MDRLLEFADGWVKRNANVGGHEAVISSRLAHALTECEKQGFLSSEEIWLVPAPKVEEQKECAVKSFCMQIRRPTGWAVDLLKEVDVAVDAKANGGPSFGKGRTKVTRWSTERRVAQRPRQAAASGGDAMESGLHGESEPDEREGPPREADEGGSEREAMPEEEDSPKKRARVQSRTPFESLIEDLAEEQEDVEATPRGDLCLEAMGG